MRQSEIQGESGTETETEGGITEISWGREGVGQKRITGRYGRRDWGET